VRDWNLAAAQIPRKGKLCAVNLWLDSTDLPLQNPTGFSKKDVHFSYKLNRYGRRYMIAQDGRRNKMDRRRLFTQGL
jgi:hypothetical protein